MEVFRQIRARTTGKRLQSKQDVKAQGGYQGNIFEMLLLGEKESKKRSENCPLATGK